MTNISTPQQSEYSFQHQTPTEPQAPNTKVLDVLKVKKDTLLLSSLTSPTLKRKIKLST